MSDSHTLEFILVEERGFSIFGLKPLKTTHFKVRKYGYIQYVWRYLEKILTNHKYTPQWKRNGGKNQ